MERWRLRVEQPHASAACASWQPHHATRRCSSTMSSIGRRANTMHLCTENIRSRSRSHRRLPSKIHAATPPQNLAAVESLLRARELRAALPWRSYPKRNRERRPLFLAVCGISNKNKMDRSFLYICAPLRPAAPLLGPRFLYSGFRALRNPPIEETLRGF